MNAGHGVLNGNDQAQSDIYLIESRLSPAGIGINFCVPKAINQGVAQARYVALNLIDLLFNVSRVKLRGPFEFLNDLPALFRERIINLRRHTIIPLS